MAFKQLSQIDDRTKLCVHGWIRMKEKSLRLTNIPSMINAICILYFRDDETFNVIAQGVESSANQKRISKILSERVIGENNYGINEMVSTTQFIYQWNLRVVKCGDNDIIFGITSNKKAHLFGDGYNYAFSRFGEKTCTIRNSLYFSPYIIKNSYGKRVEQGDIVTIIVDFKKGHIKIAINGIEQGILSKNVFTGHKDIKYRLNVCLFGEGDCVEITNFSKI